MDIKGYKMRFNLILLVLLLTVNCQSTAEKHKQKNPLAPSANKQLTTKQQANDIKAVIATIPKVASIGNKNSRIDFLQKTKLLNSNEQTLATEKRIYLGQKSGKSIYYIEGLAENNLSTNTKALEQIISYNHRRNKFGVFKGKIDIVVIEPSYIAEISKIYSVQLKSSFKNYATFKLNNLEDVATVYNEMKSDSKIKKVRLKLSEDEIVKY